MHARLLYSLYIIFLTEVFNCKSFSEIDVEYEVIDSLYYTDRVFVIQTEKFRSAISVGLELCRYHIPLVMQGEGLLKDCVIKIGEQISSFRKDPTHENARYVNSTHISVDFVWKIPTNITYNPNLINRSPCRGLEGTSICRLGGKGDEVINVELVKLNAQHHNMALAMSIPPWNTSDVICTWRHSHLSEEFAATLLSESASSDTFLKPVHRGAIVILAQAGEHSTYTSRQSLPQLMRMLSYLYKNYNDRHHDDIWIFHEGDFSLETQVAVRQNRNEIRFYKLEKENWELYPSFVHNQTSPNWSEGYHKMLRWFAIRIWHVMHNMGYTWVWRMDDDSFLLSPIEYNMFAFMEHYNYQYAYRSIAVESPGSLFWDFIQAYVRKSHVTNIGHIMDSCLDKQSIDNFTFSNCGHMPGYYNNFFVTNVSRWLDHDVQQLLTEFDESGMLFLERWGDLTVQSSVVRLLFDEKDIHRFTGWGYAHLSGQPNVPYMGLIQGGALNVDQYAVLRAFGDDSGFDSKLYDNHFTMANNRLLTIVVKAACTWHNYAHCIC